MKFIHFADVHLGMENFGRLDAKTGIHSRIVDFLKSMDFLCETVEKEQPDFILFCGDAFKTRTPNPTLVSLFAARVQRLADVAPLIMIVGNHDRQKGGSEKKHSIQIFEELEARNEIVVCDAVDCIEVSDAVVIALPWIYDNDVETTSRRLQHIVKAQNIGKHLILAGHCTVEGSGTGHHTFYVEDEDVYPLNLFDAFDYVALGHIHRHQILQTSPPIVYSGSMERVDWGERHDPKGFVIVELGKGRVDWEFVDCNVRQMLDLEVDYADLPYLREEIATDAIVRLLIHAKRSVPYKSTLDKAYKYLPGLYLLDTMVIDTPNTRVEDRLRNTRHIEQMSVLDQVEVYLSDRHPEDREYVDLLLDYAEELIAEVDREWN